MNGAVDREMNGIVDETKNEISCYMISRDYHVKCKITLMIVESSTTTVESRTFYDIKRCDDQARSAFE
jgi:DNA polymerase III sliding clamp (beta) subunit (PCNA family)